MPQHHLHEAIYHALHGACDLSEFDQVLADFPHLINHFWCGSAMPSSVLLQNVTPIFSLYHTYHLLRECYTGSAAKQLDAVALHIAAKLIAAPNIDISAGYNGVYEIQVSPLLRLIRCCNAVTEPGPLALLDQLLLVPQARARPFSGEFSDNGVAYLRKTPFSVASCFEVYRRLVEHIPVQPAPGEDSPLYHAIHHHRFFAVDMLIEHGYPTTGVFGMHRLCRKSAYQLHMYDSRSDFQGSLLHHACVIARPEIINCLMSAPDAFASVDMVCSNGTHPLSALASRNYLGIFFRLACMSRQLNVRDVTGATPLLRAVFMFGCTQFDFSGMLSTLLRRGMDKHLDSRVPMVGDTVLNRESVAKYAAIGYVSRVQRYGRPCHVFVPSLPTTSFPSAPTKLFCADGWFHGMWLSMTPLSLASHMASSAYHPDKKNSAHQENIEATLRVMTSGCEFWCRQHHAEYGRWTRTAVATTMLCAQRLEATPLDLPPELYELVLIHLRETDAPAV